jgi:hypothetical protein
MARITAESYRPQLQFRFRIIFSVLDAVQFYGKSVDLPSAENNPITVEYGNTYMKVKGKTRWNDINITCYSYEDITQIELWEYLDKLHHGVKEGKDGFAKDYKRDIQIQLLAPDEEKVVGTWRLVGAFVASINYGKLDWGAEEVVQPELTLAYDYAIYEDANNTTEPI